MSCQADGSTNLTAATAGVAGAPELHELERAFDTIAAELALIAGNPQRVDGACVVIRRQPSLWTLPPIPSRLQDLAGVVKRSPRAATPHLVSLLFDAARVNPDPWPILSQLVTSTDPAVGRAALEQLRDLLVGGRLVLDEELFEALAGAVESGPAPLRERAMLEEINAILSVVRCAAGSLVEIWVHSTRPLSRVLAARLLDLSSSLPAPTLAESLLGAPLAGFLETYFAFTRATHLDLVQFALGAADPSSLLEDLRSAEKTAGAALLREVLGQLGWKAVNCGLTVAPTTVLSVGGSFPVLVAPRYAALLGGCPGVRALGDRLLFVAYAGLVSETGEPARDSAVVERYRACNLRHADALADLLDVAPLTYEKVERMCGRVGEIVEDFCALFEAHCDECAEVRRVYTRLHDEIQLRLLTAPAGRPLPPDLTRLVQMFEDPATAADIHTLHGCKRYLHQRGLRLGFKLAETAGNTNRAVTLALGDGERVCATVHAIDYVDFEPAGGPARAPYVVRVAVDAYSRHLLLGESSLPKLRFFCYGNEVHCFASYRNHPAFIRVDFSPPQRGGMIDLEYCGVSKYDLDWHPNPSLTAIEIIFNRFDFDINVTDTRIRARYDKERASDLSQLSAKIEGLFRLVPALMDVDWVIGDLQLSDDAKSDVAHAWADFFERWGIVPLRHVLTADRLGILAGVRRDAAGDHEIRWTGTDAYTDCFSVSTPPGFWGALRGRLAENGLAHLAPLPSDGPISQREIDTLLVSPLSRAVARGEVACRAERFVPTPPSLFRSVHEARLLADVLDSTDVLVAESARLARLASLLEGTLRFEVTGTINGYEVQRAIVSLPERTIAICGLRDGGEMLRAALFVEGDSPYERREDIASPWTANWRVNADALAAVLRRSNYTPPWTEPPNEAVAAAAAGVRRAFSSPNVHGRLAPVAGERIIRGLKASPGRAVGIARIGFSGRRPADLTGGIIVASALSPADNPFVFRSKGVVTTGGGILSHAGLLALQFQKPAVVVSGRLERQDGGIQSLVCTRVAACDVHGRPGGYDVVEHHDATTYEERVEDGDVVVVDATAAALVILGQQSETLALDAELHRLLESAHLLAAARTDCDLLVQRGAMLRARHQLERLLGRIDDPVLAKHAVTELMAGEAGSDPAIAAADKARLLGALCGNERVAGTARAVVRELMQRVLLRLDTYRADAMRLIPSASDPAEVLALRLDVLRAARLLENLHVIVGSFDVAVRPDGRLDGGVVDDLARSRLSDLREAALTLAKTSGPSEAGLPHLLKQLDKLDEVLANPCGAPEVVVTLERQRSEQDEGSLRQAAGACVLRIADGGAELWPLIGSKAANLAEAARLVGSALVPSWFVVSDCAFRDVLSSPVPGDTQVPSLSALIERTLAIREYPDSQKAAIIRRGWEAMQLSGDLTRAVAAAYRELSASAADEAGAPDGDPSQPFVAVRSSAREEDTETAARAGEFDTFLFVRGERALCEHLKRAWSGLWNERAIHNRAVLGISGEVGGGVIVQRMVWARVAGVLHTVNLAAGQWREMVINVGLGLGEGVVSGAVAADQVIVAKDGMPGAGPFRFRYLTNDKRERVVFDRSSGCGTRRVETLYHQRLRPALEYVELCELVQTAARLEAAFRQPLDIEFAIAAQRLYVLQVRPIPVTHAVWRDTLERYPLARRPS